MRRLALAAAPLLLLLNLPPRAAAAGEALKVELVPKAQKGQGSPELVVRAEASIAKLALDVVRSTDGKRLRLEAGPVLPGRTHHFPLELRAPGTATFDGKLSVVLENGERGEMPIRVEAELLEALVVTVSPGDVDLVARSLRLASSRPISRVEISVMSDTGTPLGTTETEVGEEGGRYLARWEQSKGTVLRISVKALDAHGFFGGVELFPWRVDIPHEEVNFRSGSFDVDAAETPKLEASFALIQQAIAKYGKLATIRLFVAGHTDTVGDPGSNRTLSNNRARSLGRWLRKRGVQIPIQYAGFGEELLLVETPDETDQAKNRRAEYIVAVEAPVMKGSARFVPLD